MSTSAITTGTCCAAGSINGSACSSRHTKLSVIYYRRRKQRENRFVPLCAEHYKAAQGRRGIGLPGHDGAWWLLSAEYERSRR